MLLRSVLVFASLWLASAVAQSFAQPGAVRGVGCCGASEVSEGTVAKGLKWLAAQQQSDGSWPSPPEGADGKPQALHVSATHSTALVMLSYLGAGQTSREGIYQDQLRAGVKYLESQLSQSDDVGDLRGGGDLVAHGVAALALAEAYGMTHAKELIVPAQLAVRYTEHSQNRETGGWGPQPQDRDDMHVAGWQLLTLRSAKLGGLLVADAAGDRSLRYLNNQRAAKHQHIYGRHMPGYDVQATAIGLVGYAALNNVDDDERWREAARWATSFEFSAHDVERNLWLTLVARHAGDKTWAAWNKKLRDAIVMRQTSDGHERGSWFDAEDIAVDRGRVYQTALNTMCLEVYYRHLPAYRDDFRIERGDEQFGGPAESGAATEAEAVDDLFDEPNDDPFAN